MQLVYYIAIKTFFYFLIRPIELFKIIVELINIDEDTIV
jgi:hypothetical protein